MLGFVGLSMVGLQFLLSARFRPVVRPFGIDLAYHFHRQISFAALGLILAHPIILILAGYYIDTPGKQALWIILGLFWIGALLYIRVIKPILLWRKPYSLVEVRPERVELSVKDLGDFTAKVKTLAPGTRACLDGPYGMFSIDYYPSLSYVFLAGGIGITPFMSRLSRDLSPAKSFLFRA